MTSHVGMELRARNRFIMPISFSLVHIDETPAEIALRLEKARAWILEERKRRKRAKWMLALRIVLCFPAFIACLAVGYATMYGYSLLYHAGAKGSPILAGIVIAEVMIVTAIVLYELIIRIK